MHTVLLDVLLAHTAFKGCPFGTDPMWGVMWANTQPGTIDIERCPGGLESYGMATRFCNLDGIWDNPVVTRCGSLGFQIILQQVHVWQVKKYVLFNLHILCADSNTSGRHRNVFN